MVVGVIRACLGFFKMFLLRGMVMKSFREVISAQDVQMCSKDGALRGTPYARGNGVERPPSMKTFCVLFVR